MPGEQAELLMHTPHDAVMWTVGAISDRDGVSRQAVGARARRFAEAHGLIVERDSRSRIIKLNVVQYDQLRGQFAEPSKVKAPRSEQKPPSADSLDEARRQQAWLDAERSRLALDEQRGRLVPVAAVLAAFSEAGDLIAAIIDRLPNISDDLAPEVIKAGPSGLRVGLTKEAHRMRDEIANALRRALEAPAKPADGDQGESVSGAPD